MIRLRKTISLIAAICMLLAALPTWAAGTAIISKEDDHPDTRTGEHNPVNFYMTDMDYTSVTSVEDGGTGLHATTGNRYTYLGITERSDMYSCCYLIDYPDEFVTITNQSISWSGGLIAQTLASMDDDEQTSDNFDSVCNLTYEGQTGGKPVGEAGNMYINGGVYLKTFDFNGVQLGGYFHRFTVRLDKTPAVSQCMQDENGYYLPIGLEMLEFTFAVPDEDGVIHASVNWCKPENIENAPWLSWTSGKLYVTPSSVEITAEMEWDDDNDRDGIRPEAVAAELYANGEATGLTMELKEENNWSIVFADLPTYQNGLLINYTVSVSNIPGYSVEISGNAMDGYTITAIHAPEVTELYGAVNWIDGDDIGGIRPESVMLELTGNGEPITTFDMTAADGWTWSISDMYVYENHGEPIEYLIHEAELERYYTEYSGLDVMNTRIVSVSYIGGYTAEEELLFGGSVVLPVLDIPGIHYVFTVDGEPWDGTNITSDVTVEVDFEVDIYNVTFIDPVAGEALAVEQAEYGEGVEAPTAPEHYGYEFAGWDCDFGEVYGDMTVTAIYAPVDFTVTFTDGLGYVLSVQEVPYLTAANPPEVPERIGWVFVGWDADYTCIEQDTVINAVWEKQRLTISFTGAYTGVEVVEYGDDCPLPVYDSEAICYIFMQNGEEFCPENITENADVTVSVALIKNTYYSVTFVGFDGEIISQQTVKHGQTAAIPYAPAVPGYRFVGWDRDVEMLSSVTYSVTRYALYEPAGEPEAQPGDINGDGEVTFADISALYSFLLGSSDIDVTLEMGDINADGEVTFADISALYDRIIS